MAQNLKIPLLASDPTINLALDTLNNGKQALVFVNTKRGAEKTAEEISKKIKTGKPEWSELAEKILKALPRPTKQCERLSRCVKKGSAFHHAGLNSKQRELVEDAFRDGTLKIISATPTLAYGLNLPAFRVIIRDLKRYGMRGYNDIPVLEYLQFAGRAGRPQFHDKFGEAIAIASSESEKDRIYKKYVLGEPEDILSKLAVEPALRMYTLSLIATDYVNSKQSMMDFFKKTFFAFQYGDTAQIEIIIEKMIGLLDKWGFIVSSKQDDFQNASDLGNESLSATALGKRVAELYLDPLTANHIINCLKRAGSPNAFAVLQMISHTIEMRPLLRIRVKEMDDIQDCLVKHNSGLIDLEPSVYDPEYEDFLDSVKTAMFMNDWIEEKDEDFLFEKYNIRPGEIHAKLNIADWLIYASHELGRILKMQSLLRELTKTRIRLKHGSKEELLPLLRLKEIGRIRARALFRNNIKDIAGIKQADVVKLIQILGRKTALSIKEQVGQKIAEVPKAKRKGQLSLNKY